MPGDYQILLHSWECFSLPWHTRTSLLKFTLGCQSSSNTPLSNVSSCCDIRGSQSDIIPLAKPVPGMFFWGLKVQCVQQSIPSCRICAVLSKLEFTDSQSNIFWIKCIFACLKIDEFCWCVLHLISFKCPDVSTLKENTQQIASRSIYTEKISNMKCYFQHRGIF